MESHLKDGLSKALTHLPNDKRLLFTNASTCSS